MNRYGTYHSRCYSTYLVHDYVCLPTPVRQLLLVSIPWPTWAHDPPTVDPRKLLALFYTPLFYVVHMYAIHVCFWIAVNEDLKYLCMNVLQIINE